ncbi:MAG: alpha-glucosidase C-terminal domain-containing protein [Phycisphaerae bacterium]|nr:alpha-glucosidase C-terminal domain-containing protein [Phycisphaerae bacterium]
MRKTGIGITGLLLAVFARNAHSSALNERQARPSPEWVTRGVMYQIQPRAFTPEGTLAAATARLPKVAEIGVDIIYICPVFVADDEADPNSWSPRQRASRMNNPRNPYRMKDYYHVDPEYGTDDDLKAFVAAAHKLGMRVLLDMVYLHCGPNAVFLDKHPDFVKRDKDGNVANAAWGFPALNHANPELREYLWKNMEYWLRGFNVDGFRCDVSDRVPLDFWETARDRLAKIRPDVCMLAEGRRREDQLKAFDLDYGWGFKWNKAADVRKHWEKMYSERPRGGARFIRFITNHDVANDAFHNRIEKKWGAPRVDATLVALFTLDGVPMLYNGQEVADTARHSIFGRSPIDWANANTPTGKARLALCKKLCAIRHAERPLTHGPVTWLDNNAPEAVLSYLRTLDNQQILTVINLTAKPTTVQLKLPPHPTPTFHPLLARGAKQELPKDGNHLFALDAYAYFVGKR